MRGRWMWAVALVWCVCGGFCDSGVRGGELEFTLPEPRAVERDRDRERDESQSSQTVPPERESAGPPETTPIRPRPREPVTLAGPEADAEPVTDARPRSKRLLVFTRRNCPPCRELPGVYAELRKAGYMVETRAAAHVQEVLHEVNPGWLTFYKVTGTPTWLLLERVRQPDGRVVEVERRRVEGLVPADEVDRLWHGDAVVTRVGSAGSIDLAGEARKYLRPGPFELPLAPQIDAGRVRVTAGTVTGRVELEDDGRVVFLLDKPVRASVPWLPSLLSAGIERVEVSDAGAVAVSQRGVRYRVWVEEVGQ